MTRLPPPLDLAAPVADLVRELAGHLGTTELVELCVDLLGGADRSQHLDALPYLTGHDWTPGSPVTDPTSWDDYWVRTWGARGLLHVWADSATSAVVAGLADEHWRPAEMCLKVTARHEVVGAADAAAALATHDRPRVRAQAVRALGAVGDTEHVKTVEAARDDPAPAVRRAAARALESLVVRLDLPPQASIELMSP
ncbi:HEAT repeat domain-containing protein [Nocardioides sp.]|uniref:HEAT repeat domain-containing protein n=1 Tax=Nocardioides sp. TaxID=35761 RepID=UPI00286B704D|nr:HEAT repeat domain-containing protein [Nocardioides sp.]